jgi:Rrf2 family protein
MLSQTSEYALRAVLYLADRHSREPVRVAVMAQALGVPQNYLSKTLHALVRVGVLESERGPAGGFRLAREPHRLPLKDVVAPFDPQAGERRCLLGRPQCGDHHACAAHEAWSRASGQVAEFFRTTTVAELLSLASAAPATSSPRRPR